MSKLKGIYIVSETGALYPSTGASQHIRVGMEQLGRTFDMEQLLICKPLPDPSSVSAAAGNTGEKKPETQHSGLRRYFSWIYLLLSNHLSFFRYLRILRKARPDFIYERAGYLNYNALIISGILRIPHFYEVNGIAANDHAKYFPAVCNRMAFRLEKRAYRHSGYGFYVGGIQKYFNIAPGKYSIIQNGVDRIFAEQFVNRVVAVNHKINIVFIGTPMDHHRLDIFVAVLKSVNEPEKYSVSFIGPGLDYLETQIPPGMEANFYGKLTHSQIAEKLNNMHVAVIPHALDYFSHVKVFMYGAAKLTVLLPETENFRRIFGKDEVMFINNGDVGDIARRLNEILRNPDMLQDYGAKLYAKVSASFTWENIYDEIASAIRQRLTSAKINTSYAV